MESFDQNSFQDYDVVSRHPCVHDSVKDRILSHIDDQLQNGVTYSRSKPLVIADIGCGNGSFIKSLVKNDIPKSITCINTYLMDPFGDKNSGIMLFNDIDFQTKFASNYCDIILCKCVAHLFLDFRGFLLNCQRILKPNGLLLIATLTEDLKLPWGKYGQKSYDLTAKSDLFRWINMDELKQYNSIYNLSSNKLLKQCTVTHKRLSHKINVTKKDWHNLIKYRAWSCLQSLTDDHYQDCLSYVNKKYENIDDNDTIDIKIHWGLSSVVKNGAKNLTNQKLQSKL